MSFLNDFFKLKAVNEIGYSKKELTLKSLGAKHNSVSDYDQTLYDDFDFNSKFFIGKKIFFSDERHFFCDFTVFFCDKTRVNFKVKKPCLDWFSGSGQL